ncbi:FAD-binding oxidoreductase [Noviherbaspirillum cavernae]|uniref:FAD-binding oxidoreductase n=1 Tax=Noviherbaspirillum cavernae TaxID=2320862 RepID=A0A418WXR3_9BURK|nr:FAD-binding oxidoreductase [Noviherbaspirillum cavernae]RJG05016.1 FAD-binding oxidoreductase [Noviherbaspirillum cavernae]
MNNSGSPAGDSYPRSFPVYHSGSGWNAMLPARQPRTALPSDTTFDTIVIGAGYTGLAAARRLAELEPGKSVLVVDAAPVGESSAGRNSGFLINLPHNTNMGGHVSPLEVARKQIRLYDFGLEWLKQLIDSHGIDCGWSHRGKYHAAATDGGIANLKATLQQYRDWGVEFTELDQDALVQKFGTRYYKYGYHSTHNVFIQPAALIRGLADSLPANVQLLECEPVLAFDGNGPFRVHTARSTFRAGRIILANNAFAKKLGVLRDRLITIYTYAGMTPRLPEEELAKLGQENEWGIIPANRLGTTLRRTQDGRFMVRSAYSYEREQTLEQTRALLTDCYKRRYPNMASHKFEYLWGGTTALTRNGATFFGVVRPGIYASLGCNGAGVLKGSVYGRLLGDMAAGSQSELLSDVLSLERPTWLPPEPFRKIGVVSAILYQAQKAGLER